MFYKEHEPPHFHAEDQGQQGEFDFDDQMLVGNMRSKTALRLIRERATLHCAELEASSTLPSALATLAELLPDVSQADEFVAQVSVCEHT